jgi:putative tryptophan/tyrosine transport system substrate-binding protein
VPDVVLGAGEAMRRREVITVIVGTAVSWPLAARAQERRIYRLGFLVPTPPTAPAVTAFFDELRRNGFAEGHNLTIIPGGLEVTDDHLAGQAVTLLNAAPDAIVAGPELSLQALQARTHTVPIVGMAEDMVAAGFVKSLARPGGNVTGISLLSPELDGKRQDILIEMAPEARRIGAIADGRITPTFHSEALQQAARSRGVELSIFSVKEPKEIKSAIEAAKASNCEAINFLASPMFSLPGSRNYEVVVQAIAAVRLPAIFQWPETAEAGSLAGYGPRLSDTYRQRARMVARIFSGASPADIPVEQPTRFELVINLKAANALGLNVPASLVARADKVIE